MTEDQAKHQRPIRPNCAATFAGLETRQKAIHEAVGDLKKTADDIRRAVLGNGEPGIAGRVAALEQHNEDQQHNEHSRQGSASLVVAWVAAGVAIVALVANVVIALH